MDAETTADRLRQEYNDIFARLKQVSSGADRDSVKRDIIGLFKRVDHAISGLTGLREDIRVLVDSYK